MHHVDNGRGIRENANVERGKRGVRDDDVGSKLPDTAIKMKKTPHSPQTGIGEIAPHVRSLKLAAAMFEVRQLRQHRRDADFVATLPMLDSESFGKDFGTRQPWRMDDLQYPHLSPSRLIVRRAYGQSCRATHLFLLSLQRTVALKNRQSVYAISVHTT